eukprot:SAG11_NODE_8844_length_970_cov_1.401837_1_plen_108_part_00
MQISETHDESCTSLNIVKCTTGSIPDSDSLLGKFYLVRRVVRYASLYCICIVADTVPHRLLVCNLVEQLVLVPLRKGTKFSTKSLKITNCTKSLKILASGIIATSKR